MSKVGITWNKNFVVVNLNGKIYYYFTCLQQCYTIL